MRFAAGLVIDAKHVQQVRQVIDVCTLQVGEAAHHSAFEHRTQVQGALLMDVVVGYRAFVLQLLASKREQLLVWWDTFALLEFGFHSPNGVGCFHTQCDGLASERLHEDLHSAGDLQQGGSTQRFDSHQVFGMVVSEAVRMNIYFSQ